MLELNRVYCGDCLEVMKDIDDGSVDMILCDLPYGTTRCKWDTIIPFGLLWEHYERIIKDCGAIALNASQPFTSALIMSNPRIFKYCWTWDKLTGKGHLVAKIRPLQQTEDIVIFGLKRINYYPIMEEREKPVRGKEYRRTDIMGGESKGYTKLYTHKYPKTILAFPGVSKPIHPTQKPVALFEYLIRTYTKEGETVLDNCLGSGTTAVSCINQKRNFIGIEKDPEYCAISERRIEEAIRG